MGENRKAGVDGGAAGATKDEEKAYETEPTGVKQGAAADADEAFPDGQMKTAKPVFQSLMQQDALNVSNRRLAEITEGLTSKQHRLAENVRQGRRLTEQDLPRSYLHTAEEVLARRRLIHGVRTPRVLAALLKEIEEQN